MSACFTHFHATGRTPGGQAPSRRNCTAFTLIEMLIVIAIIGLLAGLLLPAINGVRKHARRVSARAEVQQLAAAWTQYYSAYERWPSPALIGDAEAPVQIIGDLARVLSSGERMPDNPKALRFMEFTRTRDGEPVNPWADTVEGHDDYSYYAMFDVGYDNVLRQADAPGILTNDVQRTVIVWTVDPELDPDDENYIVGSWK